MMADDEDVDDWSSKIGREGGSGRITVFVFRVRKGGLCFFRGE